jgi:hypothetical protein
VEPLTARPCIQLSAPCLHVYHQRCVLQQLHARWPGHRLTFRFLLCPLCRQPLSHPSLTSALRPLLAVKERALQRLFVEGREVDRDVVHPAGAFYGDELGYALHVFVFHLCHHVPYTTPRTSPSQ